MSEPFIGQIKVMSFAFPPRGWTQCNGQLLPINQNQALFSILATSYGGDGTTTFALPNMTGCAPMNMGGNYNLGQRGGESYHSLAGAEVPQHTHTLMADATTDDSVNSNSPDGGSVLGQSGGQDSNGTQFAVNIYSTDTASLAKTTGAMVSNSGVSQWHENRQPYLVLNFCIALQGIYPSRN